MKRGTSLIFSLSFSSVCCINLPAGLLPGISFFNSGDFGAADDFTEKSTFMISSASQFSFMIMGFNSLYIFSGNVFVAKLPEFQIPFCLHHRSLPQNKYRKTANHSQF